MIQRNLQCSRKNLFQTGFTLVELLIVMIILGVLTSIIAGNFVGARVKARDSKRKADLTQLQRAVEMYHNDYGKYPLSDGGKIDLDGVGEEEVAIEWGEQFVDSKGTVYMIRLPNDSKAPATQFYYRATSDGKSYQAFTYLENERDDDILDLALANLVAGACGTAGSCNYGVNSSNITVDEDIQ